MSIHRSSARHSSASRRSSCELIDDVNPSRSLLCEARMTVRVARRSGEVLQAVRSINGCAARHSNASRYKLLSYVVDLPRGAASTSILLNETCVARCVTVPRRASSNASRYIVEMRYCASPSCDELTSSINAMRYCVARAAHPIMLLATTLNR